MQPSRVSNQQRSGCWHALKVELVQHEKYICHLSASHRNDKSRDYAQIAAWSVMLHQANMWELWEMHPQQNLPIYFSSYMECKAACRRWMEIKRLLLLRHTLDRWRRQAATFNDLKSAADQDGKRIKPVNVCSREWRGATKWPPNPLRVCVCVCVVSVLWAKKNTIAWELYDSYIIMTVWQYIYLYIYIYAMILTKLPNVDLHNFVYNRQ